MLVSDGCIWDSMNHKTLWYGNLGQYTFLHEILMKPVVCNKFWMEGGEKVKALTKGNKCPRVIVADWTRDTMW